MLKNKKFIFGAAIIIAALIGGTALVISGAAKYDGPVRTMTCYHRPNKMSGKHGLPISCLKDRDCDLFDENVAARMKKFCNPAEVGFWGSGFKDFCGNDGYCKQDRSHGPSVELKRKKCAEEGETIGAQGMPKI